MKTKHKDALINELVGSRENEDIVINYVIGDIVRKTNALEVQLTDVIVNYYSRDERNHAMQQDFFLDSRCISISQKFDIINRIAKRLKLKTINCKKYIKLRNIYAHSLTLSNRFGVIGGKPYTVEIEKDYKAFIDIHNDMLEKILKIGISVVKTS